MPRSFQNQFDIPFSWSKTALAVWHKYPNPFATHVISMDVIGQQYDPETGLLRVERIIGVQQGAPTWALKLLGGTKDTYVREVTMIDPSKESFEMTSTNLSLSQYLLVKEYITYLPNLNTTKSPQPQSSIGGNTTFTQKALIECTGLSGGMLDKAAKKVEEMSFRRFGENAEKGRQGILSVCKALWD